MSESFVVRESRPGGVELLRLDRPPLNALCTALLQELAGHARDIADNPEVKAVVVTGSDRAFAAGADISEFTGQDAARAASDAFRAAHAQAGTANTRKLHAGAPKFEGFNAIQHIEA